MKKQEENQFSSQEGGTKSEPIDIMDDDEILEMATSNTSITKIKPPTVSNPINNSTPAMVVSNKNNKMNNNNDTKKKITDMMATELYKLKKKKKPDVEVTDDEYRAIELFTRKKFGLTDGLYVSKKLVQSLASKIEQRRIEEGTTTENTNYHIEEHADEAEVEETEEEQVQVKMEECDSDSDESLVF